MPAGWSMIPGIEKLAQMHHLCVLFAALFALWGAAMWQRAAAHQVERRRQRRLREEMEAYAYLDTRPDTAGLDSLSLRVCRIVIEKSPFHRVALLLGDAERRLYVAGSSGLEPSVESSLARWASGVNTASATAAALPQVSSTYGAGPSSFSLLLDPGPDDPGPTRIIVIPIRSTGRRRMLGAIVVGAGTAFGIPRTLVAEALAPLEMLAVKLGRAIENAAVADRLLRAEKLAGLGMLAGGVAHALNNPLTAVMGFAELIAESTPDPSTQEDAATIVSEARRMKNTVDSLLNFWRPSIHREEPVSLDALLRELAAECSATLASRGVRLIVETSPSVPSVHGNRDRLRQVLEHLLNNAAQAIAGMQVGLQGLATNGKHAIRLALSHDTRSVQLIVSDTGPGFREPNRVFDPFYTTRDPGEGNGLGLSICYGILREHGGEISAFNLHPHGAAVILELPTTTLTTEADPHDHEHANEPITELPIREVAESKLAS